MKYSKELKLGIFIVVILIVSFFTINYLRGKDIFNREIELVARYDNLEGLVASAPVHIKGYKAGKVISVSYDADSDDFEVVCSVLKEFRIPEDSRMVIYGVDIMGGKGVRIDMGTSSVMAEDGATLSAYSEPALLDGLASNVMPLVDKVGQTLDSLAVTVSGVNSLLSDSNRKSISRTIAHLERTISDVNAISSAINGRSAELKAFIDDLSVLSDNLVAVSAKADTAMTGVNGVLSTLNDSDIAGVISSLNALLNNINDPEGTVGKLLVDGSVYDSVDELLNDVDLLVKKIKENPKKYLKISIF